MQKRLHTKTPLLLLALAAGAVYFWMPEKSEKLPLTKIIRKDQLKPPKGEAFSNGEEDNHNARIEQEINRLMDPKTKRIPDRIREKELAFAERLNQSNATHKTAASGSAAFYTRRGPVNVGGRTRALAVKKSNPSVILAGGVSGGMWRSSDGGKTWSKTTGASNLHSVMAIAEDEFNANTWYYATGEFDGNSAAGGGNGFFRGDGIYKSTDDGVTWAILTATRSNTPQVSEIAKYDYNWNLKVNPLNGDLYVATWGRVDKSTDGGSTFSTVRGNSTATGYTDVDIVKNGSGVVIAVYLSFTCGNPGVHRSTDGSSWLEVSNWTIPSARAVIAIAPSNPNTIYALVYDGAGAGPTNHLFKKYTYTGSGGGIKGSWVDRSANLPDYHSTNSAIGDYDTQAGYDMVVKVKPDDENMVFIGGTNLYRSSDGFATANVSDPTTVNNQRWIGGYTPRVETGYNMYPNNHPDIHTVVFDPSDANTVFVGHDGGISKTTAATANTSGHHPVTWTSLNNDYRTTQFYSVAVDHSAGDVTDPYHDLIMGGMQDNGVWMINNQNQLANWIFGKSGDGCYAAIAPGGVYSYRGSQNGFTYRINSHDGTRAWTRIDPGFNSKNSNVLFNNPFAIDPNDGKRLYFAANKNVYRHDDLTARADYQTSSLTGWTAVGTTATYLVSAIGVSKTGSPNVVYYGSQTDGKIFRIDNATSGSPTVTDLGAVVAAYPSCISVDPANSANVLLVYSNYSVKSVWYSSNSGSSWTDVSGNLESATDGTGTGPSARWCKITGHGKLNKYFVGTSTGLYSTDAFSGTSTVWEQEGPSTIGKVVVPMFDIRESDGLVVVGTHANGVYSYRPPVNNTPEISFVGSSLSLPETTVSGPVPPDCRGYKDYDLDMQISNAPTGTATATLSVSGTATESADYIVTTNSNFSSPSKALTFSNGVKSYQTFKIRVFDDASVEGTETLVLDFAITGSTNAAKASNKTTFTLSIKDNDFKPQYDDVLLSENFEGGAIPSGWGIYATSSHGGNSSWNVGAGKVLSGGNSAYVTSSGTTYGYTNNSTSETVFYTSTIDASNFSDLELSFKYQSVGEGTTDIGSLAYLLDGDDEFIIIETNYAGVSSTTTKTVTLPTELYNQKFKLGWVWNNDGSGTPASPQPLVIDDISVKAKKNKTIQSATASSTQYLGANSEVYFYKSTTGELMARIKNLSAFDCGCTTVEYDRTGVSAVDFQSNGDAGKKLFSKTIKITPTNASPTLIYEAEIYYTAAEATGWQTATGKSINNPLMLFKVSGGQVNLVTPADPNPAGTTITKMPATKTNYDTDYGIKASFTNGFSGIGAGIEESLLPVEMMSFTATARASRKTHLEWSTANEQGADYFEIERSADGVNFEPLEQVKSKGFASFASFYQFMDHKPLSGTSYYRLKQVDTDRKHAYSQIESVSFEQQKADWVLYPMPFENALSLQYPFDDLKAGTALRAIVSDAAGRFIKEQRFVFRPKQPLELEGLENLKNGLYIISIRTVDKNWAYRVIKQ